MCWEGVVRLSTSVLIERAECFFGVCASHLLTFQKEVQWSIQDAAAQLGTLVDKDKEEQESEKQKKNLKLQTDNVSNDCDMCLGGFFR